MTLTPDMALGFIMGFVLAAFVCAVIAHILIKEMRDEYLRHRMPDWWRK